jgi:hypothetical protein
VTIPAVIEHLEGIVGELDSAPIIMGHSAGGLFTQILLDHGYGAAGVAIDSVPAEGVRVTPVSQIRSVFPVLKNPANRHRAVGFTPEQFHYAFANTLSREESDKVYQRYHIPAPGSFVWAGPLANFTPGHQDVYVNFKNENRAPLVARQSWSPRDSDPRSGGSRRAILRAPARLRLEHDPGGSNRCLGCLIPVALQNRMGVAAGQGTHVVHGVSAHGGHRSPTAQDPSPASRAGEVQQHGRSFPGPTEVGDDLGDDHLVVRSQGQRSADCAG